MDESHVNLGQLQSERKHTEQTAKINKDLISLESEVGSTRVLSNQKEGVSKQSINVMMSGGYKQN